MSNKFEIATSTTSNREEVAYETVCTIKKVFKPTEEQEYAKELVGINAMVKINAIAGSGKSSELAYIADSNNIRGLLLVFNKPMQVEAERKMPKWVTCMTTHSLAYRAVGHQYQHKLSRPYGKYVNVASTGNEIAKFFRIPEIRIDEENVISANFLGLIVKDTVAKFEGSSKDYISQGMIPRYHLSDINDRFGQKACDMAKKIILRYASRLWEERIDPLSEVLATHDMYLKLYALSKPDLSEYEIIYCDEFQDTTDVVIDLILSQKDKCKIVMVGDKNQAIYGWRGAVNALAKIECAGAKLSKSFRYGEGIAYAARCILKNEVDVQGLETIESVVSYDAVDFDKPHTILFRANMTLILHAVDLIGRGEKINLNIDVKDFCNMLASAKELFLGNNKKVKHSDIVPFTTWEELETEGKNSGALSRIHKIIESGQDGRVLKLLKSHRNDGTGLVTLTTAHKAKGLEYDQVVLADDFPSNYNKAGELVGLSDDEINLLYVATTRAIFALQPNKTLDECMDLYGVDGTQLEEEDDEVYVL